MCCSKRLYMRTGREVKQMLYKVRYTLSYRVWKKRRQQLALYKNAEKQDRVLVQSALQRAICNSTFVITKHICDSQQQLIYLLIKTTKPIENKYKCSCLNGWGFMTSLTLFLKKRSPKVRFYHGILFLWNLSCHWDSRRLFYCSPDSSLWLFLFQVKLSAGIKCLCSFLRIFQMSAGYGAGFGGQQACLKTSLSHETCWIIFSKWLSKHPKQNHPKNQNGMPTDAHVNQRHCTL